MELLVNSQTLAAELALINKIVPSKAVLPILSNVKMMAADGVFILSATDLEIGLYTSCDANVVEPGSITVNAKTLADLINQFPDTDVRLKTHGHQLLVSSEAFNSRLQTMSADDFPTTPRAEGDTFPIGAAALQLIINRTRYAISDKTQKYILNGALMTMVGTTAALVATDGKRLSVATAARPQGQQTSILLPSKVLDALVDSAFDGEMEFSHSGNHIFFMNGKRLLFSRMIDGQFPAYDKIIPRDNEKKIVVNRATLAAALRRVGIAANQQKATTFTFDSGQLTITASSAEVGDAHEQLNIVYTDEKISVTVNWEYVLDFLQAAAGQSVEIAFKNSTTPLLFTDGSDFLNVVMAMRAA